MSQTRTQNAPVALEGWSKDDKFYLLEALRSGGSKNIDDLCDKLPTKSEEDIKNAINVYKKKALMHPDFYKKRRVMKGKMTNPHVPLSDWAKYLTNEFSFEDLQTETATALRLIAEFEDIPASVCTGKIDFKAAYHTLANAMDGQSFSDDQNLLAILDKCMVETALTSKTLYKNGLYRSYITSIINKITSEEKHDIDLPIFLRPTDSSELLSLKDLINQSNYNPLNICDKLLLNGLPI